MLAPRTSEPSLQPTTLVIQIPLEQTPWKTRQCSRQAPCVAPEHLVYMDLKHFTRFTFTQKLWGTRSFATAAVPDEDAWESVGNTVGWGAWAAFIMAVPVEGPGGQRPQDIFPNERRDEGTKEGKTTRSSLPSLGAPGTSRWHTSDSTRLDLRRAVATCARRAGPRAVFTSSPSMGCFRAFNTRISAT